MLNHHNKSEINGSFLEDELINNDPVDENRLEDEYSDETDEEYNEEIYKWLSFAILLVWLASIIYL
ncbi:MAG: hypothetical protein ABI543_02805 [Ignavibacteria bacterium]